MKDRFKFRVWVKTANSYISAKDDADFVYLEEEGDITVGLYNGDLEDMMYLKEEDLIIEQCTGLKDKNGKLIYEGDILATSNTQPEAAEDYWTKEQYGYTTVVWNDKFLCFTCTEWNFEPFGVDSVYSLDFVEVVGNIHENPELLER